jgi:hypothetical protein
MIDTAFLASAIRRIEQAPRGQWFRVFRDEATRLMKAHNGAETEAALRQVWLTKNRTREYTDAQFENIIAAARSAANGARKTRTVPPKDVPPYVPQWDEGPPRGPALTEVINKFKERMKSAEPGVAMQAVSDAVAAIYSLYPDGDHDAIDRVSHLAICVYDMAPDDVQIALRNGVRRGQERDFSARPNGAGIEQRLDSLQENDTTSAKPRKPTRSKVDWPDLGKGGQPSATCTNARKAIEALGIECRYDIFHDNTMC